jgi:hypothetical protein
MHSRTPFAPISYPSRMREDLLRQFFNTKVNATDLAGDLRNTVTYVTPIVSRIAIEDMQGSFRIERQHVIMLCDAFLSTIITPEALNTISFALIASDHFEWDDEIISEVLRDWSAPEINLPINNETISIHRSWLTGIAEPLPRPKQHSGRIVSVREKLNSRERDH